MQLDLTLLLIIALCGGAGAVLRLIADTLIAARFGSRMPWGTITINLSGSFALGLFTGFFANSVPNQAWLLAIGTGLLGGYTTFSTASFDTVRLLKEGRALASLANAMGTLVGAIIAAYLGFLLATGF